MSESSEQPIDEPEISEPELVSEKLKFGQKIKLFFQAIEPIITSHHPNCEQYEDHSFRLFGRKWCIGCYIGYPSAILMLLVGYLTGLFNLMETRTLWIIGWGLLSTYIFSIIGLTKIRWIKIVSKIPIGFGSAYLIAALFSYEVNFWISFLLSFLLVQFFLIIISIKRGFEMKKTCGNCEYEDDRNNCPGLNQVYEKLNKLKKRN